jgi:hypothetical protein
MTLLVGFHFQDDSYGGPEMGAATFLDVGGWGSAQHARQTMCRPYFKGKPEPQYVAERALLWHGRGARVVVANEPNLKEEDFPGGPEDYAAYFLEVQRRAPGVRLYYAGMAPADALNTPLVKGNWRDWYTHPSARQSIASAAGIVVHAYGTPTQIVDTLLFFDREFRGKPLWLSEFNPGAGNRFNLDAYAQQLPELLTALAQFHQLEAATWFSWKWDYSPKLPSSVDARGTAVERILRDWRAPETSSVDVQTPVLPQEPAIPAETPKETPMPKSNPWAGKILTVWNLPPDPANLIQVGRDLALDGFEIKVADGDSSWLDSPKRNVTRAYADALKTAGFRVCGWSYNYCDGLVNAGDRGDGIPEREADAALRAIRDLGLDGWTADLEIECEGHPREVAQMLSRVYCYTPVPIAAHVWGDLAGHASYPVAEIVRHVGVVRPMIYRPVWSSEPFWTSWAPYLDGKIVCPVWGITHAGATAEFIATDMAYADAKGIPGEAYWEYSGYPGQPGVSELIRARSFATRPENPDTADFDALWEATEHLARLEHTDLAVRMQQRIAAIKARRAA